MGVSCASLLRFSSNFLAGKKGSKVMGAIWKAQKEHLGPCRPCTGPRTGRFVAGVGLGSGVGVDDHAKT